MTEPLVLLPGMMCDARVFAPQIIALSAERAVMVAPVTLADHIDAIAGAILNQLPARFAIVGLNLGGIVALEILARVPHRVTRICLMGVDPLAETPAAAAAREPLIVRAQAGRLNEVLREAIPPDCLAPGPDRVQVLNRIDEMGRDLGPEVFVRQSRALQRRRDQQATLRRCKIPALVMCGALDTLCPVKRNVLISGLIPCAELVVLDEAGHLPPLEQPEPVIHNLRGWLEKPLVLQ